MKWAIRGKAGKKILFLVMIPLTGRRTVVNNVFMMSTRYTTNWVERDFSILFLQYLFSVYFFQFITSTPENKSQQNTRQSVSHVECEVIIFYLYTYTVTLVQ